MRITCRKYMRRMRSLKGQLLGTYCYTPQSFWKADLKTLHGETPGIYIPQVKVAFKAWSHILVRLCTWETSYQLGVFTAV